MIVFFGALLLRVDERMDGLYLLGEGFTFQGIWGSTATYGALMARNIAAAHWPEGVPDGR